MDIWRLLTAIIRRWYVITPLLVSTVAAAVTIGDWVRPEYKTSAIINIVPGNVSIQQRAAQQSANPYLVLSYTAGVLQYVLSSSSARQDLLTSGLTGTYQVKAIPNSSFIGIDVAANDPELAIATGRGVIESARQILAKRQDAVEASTTRVSIDVLDDADTVLPSTSGQLQALASVLAVGVIISIIVTVLIDDLLVLRRRRNRQTNAEVTPSSNGVVKVSARSSHRARG
ncbi:MAG: hypothetical protein ACRDSR_01165 [Pseudonocardiaceae bacterium]